MFLKERLDGIFLSLLLYIQFLEFKVFSRNIEQNSPHKGRGQKPKLVIYDRWSLWYCIMDSLSSIICFCHIKIPTLMSFSSLETSCGSDHLCYWLNWPKSLWASIPVVSCNICISLHDTASHTNSNGHHWLQHATVYIIAELIKRFKTNEKKKANFTYGEHLENFTTRKNGTTLYTFLEFILNFFHLF